jgi:hypothetical protein
VEKKMLHVEHSPLQGILTTRSVWNICRFMFHVEHKRKVTNRLLGFTGPEYSVSCSGTMLTAVHKLEFLCTSVEMLHVEHSCREPGALLHVEHSRPSTLM